MKEFALVIRRPDPEKAQQKPPEEQEDILQQYFRWFDELSAQGVLVEKKALQTKGVVLQIADGEIVDGPFVETKEVVLGFVVIIASGLETAKAIARTCPALGYGDRIEVREVVVVRRTER